MQACVDVAFPYAHLPEAFGKKIGEHQISSSVYSYLLQLSVCSLGSIPIFPIFQCVCL